MKKYFSILFIAVSLSVFAQIPTNGLIDHYPFDNTMTGTSGHTLPGVADYVDDRSSNANSAQNITTNTMSSAGIPGLPTVNTARTIAFWYKSNADATHSLFNYGTSTDYFGVVYASPNQMVFASGSNPDLAVSHTYTGNWTHVAVTYQSPNTIFYINGTQVASRNTYTYNTPNSPVSRFGISPFGGTFANYRIDDLLIYNRALTAQEITDVFSSTCPSNTTPLQNQTVCPGATTTLSVSGNNVTWHDAQTGGNQLGTGSSFTTPPITQATAFYAETPNCAFRLGLGVVTVSGVPIGTIALANDTINPNYAIDS